MDKIIKDGKVAVAISPEYGAGWSTWNDVNPMDARFNQLFIEEKNQEAAYLCEQLGLGYNGGALDVCIEWVTVGKLFKIEEYDGFESIEYSDEVDWLVA